jgi:hypothetical protein
MSMMHELVPTTRQEMQEAAVSGAQPALVVNAGGAATFVWEKFFSGETHAVRQCLTWAERQEDGAAPHHPRPDRPVPRRAFRPPDHAPL